MRKYRHLNEFSDFAEFAARHQPLCPEDVPSGIIRAGLPAILGLHSGPETPIDVRTDRRWERDGVAGESVSWSVGFGPRTEAYVLKPAGVAGSLPCVIALHDHGGYKWYGKEKIADGPDLIDDKTLATLRTGCYGGYPFANELAKKGFVVLVHDVFTWGSRRFSEATMPDWLTWQADIMSGYLFDKETAGSSITKYNLAASEFELWLEKYCAILGCTFPGVVAMEDRIALNYLLSRDDVVSDHGAGCTGLSGGGARSALLAATHAGIKAAVITGMMSTYEGLMDHNIFHSWLFFPHGLARLCDWPDIAACRAPDTALLVQFDKDDDLFTMEGMCKADEKMSKRYLAAGAPERYSGRFYPGPHKFDLKMQSEAFEWLLGMLG